MKEPAYHVVSRSFPGSTVEDMNDFAKPSIRQAAPDEIILHVGANNVHSDEFRELSDTIVNVARKIKHDLPSTSVGIPGILNRKDDESLNENIKHVNKTLRGFCNSNGWKFVSNQNIGPDSWSHEKYPSKS